MKQTKPWQIPTKQLIQKEESHFLEFKESADALDSGDIVAFVNSKGGTILIGVTEKKHGKKSHVEKLIGCDTSDRTRQKILSKARNCFPKVEAKLEIEKLGKIRFFRLNIEEGNRKPYCTNSGTYKKRGDAANEALLPDELLAMLLDREGDQFISRFQYVGEQVVAHIESIVGDFQSQIEEVKSMVDEVGTMAEIAAAR